MEGEPLTRIDSNPLEDFFHQHRVVARHDAGVVAGFVAAGTSREYRHFLGGAGTTRTDGLLDSLMVMPLVMGTHYVPFRG